MPTSTRQPLPIWLLLGLGFAALAWMSWPLRLLAWAACLVLGRAWAKDISRLRRAAIIVLVLCFVPTALQFISGDTPVAIAEVDGRVSSILFGWFVLSLAITWTLNRIYGSHVAANGLTGTPSEVEVLVRRAALSDPSARRAIRARDATGQVFAATWLAGFAVYAVNAAFGGGS